MEIELGTQFKKRGDKNRIYTVVNKLTTRDISNCIVKIRYVAESEFCGQIVIDRDVLKTTIKMGLVK